TEPFALYRTTLPNGLRLWVQPRPGSESVATYLVVRAGARYATTANNGVSHFVEHMLFTGTERWSEQEIKDVIARRGGQWNGWTDLENTGYWAHVASADLDVALDWLAQIVFHPTFPADKLEKERQVIFQEKWGRYGWIINTIDALGFGYELDRDVRRALFPGSSLGLRVVGEDASLDSLDRQALLDYYGQHYGPANATLIVVGGVEPAAVLSSVEALFGPLPAGAPSPVPQTPPLPGSGPQQVTIRGPWPTDQVDLMIGARTVGRLHPDRWALEVLAEVLDTDLMEEIRYRQGLVYGLWAYNVWLDDTGYLAIETSSGRDSYPAIQRAAEEHLARIGAGELDPQAVAEAQTALVGRWRLRMEDNRERAGWLAKWAAVLPPGEPVPDVPAALEAVTAGQVSQAVTTYVTPERRYVGLHLPVLTVASGAWLAAGFVVLVGGLWLARRLRRRARARREEP
ncbi:MAG: pitrilysin family protein, partial [Anaerolineae bacterium]